VLVLLEAEAVDSRTAAVALLLVAEREVLPPPFVLCFLSLSFSPLSSFSLVFFPPVFLSFGSPFFFSPFSLFWFFRSPPLSSVFSFSSPPSLLFLPLLLPCWLLFIEPSEWLFAVEHGEQPAGRSLGATANARPPSPAFWQVRGGWSAIVSGRWAPGERVAGKKFKLKQPFFLLPRCVIGGRR